MACVVTKKLGEGVLLTLPDGKEIDIIFTRKVKGAIRLSIECDKSIDIKPIKRKISRSEDLKDEESNFRSR